VIPLLDNVAVLGVVSEFIFPLLPGVAVTVHGPPVFATSAVTVQLALTGPVVKVVPESVPPQVLNGAAMLLVPVLPTVYATVEPGVTNFCPDGLIVPPVAVAAVMIYPNVADTVQSAVMLPVVKVLATEPAVKAIAAVGL